MYGRIDIDSPQVREIFAQERGRVWAAIRRGGNKPGFLPWQIRQNAPSLGDLELRQLGSEVIVGLNPDYFVLDRRHNQVAWEYIRQLEFGRIPLVPNPT